MQNRSKLDLWKGKTERSLEIMNFRSWYVEIWGEPRKPKISGYLLVRSRETRNKNTRISNLNHITARKKKPKQQNDRDCTFTNWGENDSGVDEVRGFSLSEASQKDRSVAQKKEGEKKKTPKNRESWSRTRKTAPSTSPTPIGSDGKFQIERSWRGKWPL